MKVYLLLFFGFQLGFHPVDAAAFSNGQIQPGVYPAPALPRNFTKSPQFWRSPATAAPRLNQRQHGGLLSRPNDRESRRELDSRQASKAWTGWEDIHYLFTFGDSYTTTGFDHNGVQPNPDNPLGNPPYPGATSSNGPNYIDFLATTYNRSYIQAYNLGYGGATVDQALVASSYGPVVQSFEQQVTDTFIPVYSNNDNVSWTSNDTLFSIFFGINDVLLSYAARNDSLNYDIIKAYEGLVNRLYAAGARNFVFLNVPPVDRSPGSSVKSASDRSDLARYIGVYNWRLRLLVYYLGLRHPDTTTFFLDTNWLFTRVIDNPAQFIETAGYKNTTADCGAYNRGTPTLSYFVPSCGVPVDQYLWLNDLHPTYPMHNLLASEIVRMLEE